MVRKASSVDAKEKKSVVDELLNEYAKKAKWLGKPHRKMNQEGDCAELLRTDGPITAYSA